MPPPTRALGKEGPQVPAMGLGLMGLSVFYGAPKPDEERFELLDRALELGETFWDSSDIYLDSEDLVGRWFKRTGKRDEIFLATKFGIVFEGEQMRICGTKEYVREACEKSLRRLGVECIDLYYVHRVSSETPIEETILAMVELVNEGKIKHIGISECSATTLRRAHAIHPISAIQMEYPPFSLNIERPEINLLNAARELGVAVVSYSPLGRGLLTGSIKSLEDIPATDSRRLMPRFSPENFGQNLKVVDIIGEIAHRKGVTPGQLTLAWLVDQGEDIIPIPGTTKTKNLEENMAALEITLTLEESKEIREAIEAAEVFGGRCPPRMLRNVFGDTVAWKK